MRRLSAKSSLECVKFMLIGANVLFIIVGSTLISLGVTIKTVFIEFDTFIVNNYYNLSKTAIAVGTIVVVISMFGCFAAIKRSVFLVNLYALALTCIFFSNLILTLAVFLMTSNLEKAVEVDMVAGIINYNTDTSFIWNAFQSRFHCCGINGPEDWTFYKQWFHLTSIPNQEKNLTYPYIVPDSCCIQNICRDDSSVYKHGCFDTVVDIVSECFSFLGIGSLCVASIEIHTKGEPCDVQKNSLVMTFIKVNFFGPLFEVYFNSPSDFWGLDELIGRNQLLGIIFALLLAKTIRQLKTQIEIEKINRRHHLYTQIASSNPVNVSPVLPFPSSSEA